MDKVNIPAYVWLPVMVFQITIHIEIRLLKYGRTGVGVYSHQL
jgi:hypothetical protein